jgi:Trk K+ transport system NAD-binding subunit
LKRAAKPPDFRQPPRVTSLVFWHFAKTLAPWLTAMALYLVAATALVRWDMARHREVDGDFGADLYGMYTQLFFEPTHGLPRSPLARAVFWVTPLLGVMLIARGLVRVGSSLFDVEERRRLWVRIMTEQMKGHTIVCGLGHVGVRVVESLHALGVAVVALERRREESFATVVERLGVPVHYGDVRQDEVLLGAGVREASAVVCATDDDLTNLEVAIDARRMHPGIRVVVRVFDQRVAGKIGAALHFDQTFSTAAMAGPLVALQAVEQGVVGVYRTGNGGLRVDMELPAPATWVGSTVERCEDRVDGRVVRIVRAGEALRPRHDVVVQEGDVMVLDLPAESVARLRRG